MNEITLSNNLAQIELEINHHKQIAGQSIWEIGRRLNHVKEHDLAHGQFGKWVENQGLNRSEAYKMMRIAKEIPNVGTYQHLGTKALYLIATLPDEEKQAQINRIEQGDSPTVKELQHIRKKYSAAIRRISELEEQTPQPQIQIKEVVKEVVPQDYQQAIQQSQTLAERNKAYAERNEFLEKTLRDLHAQRAEVDEKSAKYDELTEAIKQSEGQLNSYQRKIATYKNFMNLFQKADQLIMEISGLAYSKETQLIEVDGLIKSEFNDLVDRGLKLFTDLDQKRKGSDILEGEIL
ncbi:DUF3102 domain-containing protein [Streptococcus ferus]|uniref:DUF3102 domain-containing protein n=1 Tax=Streptococcus ferus TaxID=1345 RepID=UPI00359F51B6